MRRASSYNSSAQRPLMTSHRPGMEHFPWGLVLGYFLVLGIMLGAIL